MRTLLLIGIGTGDPAHLTVEAVAALNRVDVFFVLDKGGDRHDLNEARRRICRQHVTGRSYRFVEAPDPPRDRYSTAYRAAVDDWTRTRAERYEQLLRDELDEDGCGAILVWGDPSLYDGALRVVEQILARGTLALNYEVIPGISAIQMLAARHRITLNRVGRPVRITTGRLLPASPPAPGEDVVVMLDGGCAFRQVPAAGTDIFWGAYLGAEDELLVAGPLADVGERIVAEREAARTRKGWILDTYLLRRADG